MYKVRWQCDVRSSTQKIKRCSEYFAICTTLSQIETVWMQTMFDNRMQTMIDNRPPLQGYFGKTMFDNKESLLKLSNPWQSAAKSLHKYRECCHSLGSDLSANGCDEPQIQRHFLDFVTKWIILCSWSWWTLLTGRVQTVELPKHMKRYCLPVRKYNYVKYRKHLKNMTNQ